MFQRDRESSNGAQPGRKYPEFPFTITLEISLCISVPGTFFHIKIVISVTLPVKAFSWLKIRKQLRGTFDWALQRAIAY